MKNKMFMMLIIITVIFFNFSEVRAVSLIGLKNIEYTVNGGFEEVKLSFTDNIGEVAVKRFNNPERIVIDFYAAELRLKNTSVNVNSLQLSKIRSGQFMPTIARIVLDLKKDVKYNVSKNGKYYTVSIPVVESNKNNKGETKKKTKSEEEVVKAAKDETNKTIGSETKKEIKTQGKVVKMAENETNKTIESEVKKETQNSDNNQALNKVFVEYKKQGDCEVVKIKINSYKGYNAFRLKNPDRIVVDIPNGYFEDGSNDIKVYGKFIKDVRHNNFTKNIARIILDVLNSPNYEVIEETDGLKILVKYSGDNAKDMTPGKVQYISTGDRVCLKINKLGFTNNEGFNISNYTEKYDKKNKTYTIIFDKDIANLKNEILKIDDSYIDKIEIVNGKQKTKIVFFAKDNFSYEVISRKKAKDTVIVILNKYTRKKSPVVIDAGHGGKEDPGAVYNLFNEKCINLDIALRVEECLKRKGISTYMTRKSDIYLSEYERANIANRLNASLFVCIHNNTYEGQARGTETLYNPNNSDESIGLKNKKFATIMQKNAIKKLGTVDRGIKKRPNLVVLRKTTMPSVLIEVGFLTDPDELKLLNDPSFKQKAAQAIADAVEEMLKEEGKI